MYWSTASRWAASAPVFRSSDILLRASETALLVAQYSLKAHLPPRKLEFRAHAKTEMRGERTAAACKHSGGNLRLPKPWNSSFDDSNSAHFGQLTWVILHSQSSTRSRCGAMAYHVVTHRKIKVSEELLMGAAETSEHQHKDFRLSAKYKSLIWLAGSASAEVFADIALCPLEMTKVKIQMSPSGTFPVGFLPALRQMSATRIETRYPFGSLVPVWSRQESYSLMTQLGVLFGSGDIAGVVSAIVSSPADSLISQLGKRENKVKSASKIISEVEYIIVSRPPREWGRRAGNRVVLDSNFSRQNLESLCQRGISGNSSSDGKAVDGDESTPHVLGGIAVDVVADHGDGAATQPNGDDDAVEDNVEEAADDRAEGGAGLAGRLNAGAALGRGCGRGGIGRNGGSKGLRGKKLVKAGRLQREARTMSTEVTTTESLENIFVYERA
ncbi:hypothetical protein DFH09DRAFT_1281976 [Mycena vulgaris]|nr:hypothetical protein DFH09DRAFT_1281976 [Mycena vulgaris]